MPWPSAPVAIADALFKEFGAGGTRLPNPLDLPAVAVTRQGGSDDGVTDAARVEVVVIAENEDHAEALSEAIRSFLLDGPIEGAGAILDKIRTEVAPHRVPYPDEQMTEYVATYVASSRQQ